MVAKAQTADAALKGENSPVVSVICPMYNESGGIEKNVRALLEALERLEESWELIFIDDGSTDNCGEIVKGLTQNEPRLHLTGYARNRGRGYALRTGFKAARGEYIISTESDLSWGPTIIENLLEGLKTQPVDMVVASPYLPGGRLENVPLHRVFLSKFGNKILSLTTESRITMLSGMTRGYRREVLDSLFLESDGKEIHLEIIAQAEALGYAIGEVPAVLAWEKPEPGKKKRKSNFNARKYIYSHLMYTFGEAPFLLIGTLGLLSMFIGCSTTLYLAYQSIFEGVRAGGRPLLIIAVIFILTGVQTLLFSFLAGQILQLRKNVIRVRNRVMNRL